MTLSPPITKMSVQQMQIQITLTGASLHIAGFTGMPIPRTLLHKVQDTLPADGMASKPD